MTKKWLVLMAVLTWGCVQTSFVRTDDAFRALKRSTLPEVYLDRLPERPYRAVGLIEVMARGAIQLPEIVKRAREKGRELGCDLVIDRPLHRTSSRAPALPLLVVAAQYPTPPIYVPPPRPPQPAPPVYVPQSPAERREFVCGLYGEPGKTGTDS